MSTVHSIYIFNKFILDETSRQLTANSLPIELTSAEYLLLLQFVKNPNVPYRYADLYELVLGMEGRAQQNTIPSHISNLRKKLRNYSDTNLIKNIPNFGYKFIAEVTKANEPPEVEEQTEKIKPGNKDESSEEEPRDVETELTDHFKDCGYEVETKTGQQTKPDYSEDFAGGEERHSRSYFAKIPEQRLLFGAATAAVAALIIIIFLILLRVGSEKTLAPRLEKVDFISEPVAYTQFFVRFEGKNLNPEMVRVKVVGPGCGGDNPCEVTNGALRLYGQITDEIVEKAPLTLAPGEYHIWLENESGDVSNKLSVSVPYSNP